MAVYKQRAVVTISLFMCVTTHVTSFLMPTSSLHTETETTFQEISTTILTTQNTSPNSPEHPVSHSVQNMNNVQTSSSSLLQPTDTDPAMFHNTGESTGSLRTADTVTSSIYTETSSEQTDESQSHSEDPQYHTQDPNVSTGSTDIESSNTKQQGLTTAPHPGLDKTSIKYIALGASWGFVAIVFVVLSIVVRRQRAAKRRMVLDHDDSETLAADSSMTIAEKLVKATAYRSTDKNSVIQNHAFSE
ncbi:uncharacterized protein [Haliotis asinina]|uniref:uncharacterized protein n=1 Tax=Haliotis asinina TaxID=109174 RepID=UPI003531D680